MSDTTGFSDDQIAQMGHDLHVAIQRALGDESVQIWSELPADAWQRDSMFAQIERVRNNPRLTAEAEHEAWRAERMAAGWAYGKIRDNEAKVSPLLIQWADLPFQYRAKSQAGIQLISTMLGQI